jgi:hypothetical protein
VFDFEHEDPTLNQIAIVVERTVDDALKAKQWDVGARVEWIWGGDSRVIHSLGLFDYNGVGDGPDNQFDLTQAYVDIAVPIGNGLRVRAGKFVTTAGAEVIDPTGNALYSHSYLFGYAIPFTHTGVLGTYQVNDAWTVTAGITRGWDTSLKDNNGTVDFLGAATWTIDPKNSLAITVITGPDQPGDNDNWRSLIDATWSYAAADNMKFTVNGDYAFERNSVATATRRDVQWFGVAGYVSVGLDRALDKNPMFTLNARVEYFNDHDGVRLTGAVGGAEVYEATLGVAIKPWNDNKYGQYLTIRPEVRYDYANKGFFDAGTEHYQVTAAVDAVYSF